MAITDVDVAALKALLVNDLEENGRLRRDRGEDGVRSGYLPLLTGAFMEAVTDRFSNASQGEVIRWIAEQRARREDNDLLDPMIAERLILWVFGKASTDDLDASTDFAHQAMLLASLVDERDLDETELDEFLERARLFTQNAQAGQ
jgi:hypothetical protein